MMDKRDKIMRMQFFISEAVESLHALSEALAELYQESDDDEEDEE